MILLKSKQEIEKMRRAGKALASVIQDLKSSLKVGMTTLEIDKIAEQLIDRKKAAPAFKGYRGFPATACISVNEEIVHGIPSNRVVKDGDIVSIDMGLVLDGWFSDSAFTIGFGDLDEIKQKLIDVTEQSLYKGIEQAKARNYLSDIGFAIQSFVEPFGFSVVRDFVGHGIGRSLHEEPEVPNFGLPRSGPTLQEGMVFAIEPMINLGTYRTKILDDKWTVVTLDKKPSAHFEHTVVVTANGPEILTKING
ncbi:MAG: type I methionyl aminopeptidase [Candidatus Omnitrophica bacterium]|nr:type I methionyl aminopeptidase [Candidatus Omnitrophota bacterium]